MEPKDLSKKVAETLESLEGIQRAVPAPFLLTRVRAAMERPMPGPWEKLGSFIARPAVATFGLLLVLLLNVALFYYQGSSRLQGDANEPSYSYLDDYNASNIAGNLYSEENNDSK
jgi:hypothetical protein